MSVQVIHVRTPHGEKKMKHAEIEQLLNQEIRALQKELNQLKRARRAQRAKARSRWSFQRIPLAG